MKLIKNRKFTYTKEKIKFEHLNVDYFSIKFLAVDNSNIYADMLVPKGNIKGVIIEFPEYETQNKDYLTLSRYLILGYAVVSIHVRGQAGKSENKQPGSIYFPYVEIFSNEPYYKFVYQDALDIIQIVKNEFSNIELLLFGVGQGAALSVVCAAFNKDIKNLFIADIALCDFKEIYKENKDEDYYLAIRKFSRNYPEKEDYLLKQLDEIDILNYAVSVGSKVYYCFSQLDVKTPKNCQEKFLALLKNKEVINYRKLEYKEIFQHAFDDFILKKLSERN
ncbi:acetylxylan esterase [Gemella sp. ND 6198]|uniref:acetylxylan esterase n=1 Tax=Gemella sp. ND 6198 TaxID=2040624 RepID=UPI000E0B912A|nr:acetylxylan esterase [Gemella sp. ND 6198]AXI26124.1 acetylxylan esterase [Gemella sp. ND 6198]